MSFTRKNRKTKRKTYKRSGGGKPGSKTNKQSNTTRTLRKRTPKSQSSAANSNPVSKLPKIGDYYPLGGKNHGYYYYATMYDGKIVNKLNNNIIQRGESWMVYEPHLKNTYKSKREIKEYLENHLKRFKKGDEPAPPPGTTVPTSTILK